MSNVNAATPRAIPARATWLSTPNALKAKASLSAAPDELLELELLLATAPKVEPGAVEKPDLVLLGEEAAAVFAVDVGAAVVAAPI